MKFPKGSPLYAVRCSAYSNSYQGCRTSLKFVNDKNFNGAVTIFFFSFKVPLFLTPDFYFQTLKTKLVTKPRKTIYQSRNLG